MSLEMKLERHDDLQDDDFVKPYRGLIETSTSHEPLMNNVADTPESIPQPTLTTERLMLEPFKDTDVEDIFQYASRSEVSRFVPWETHKSLQDSLSFLDYIRKMTSHVKGKLFYVFAIRLKETGRVIGSFDFKNANSRCGQIDYALGFEYWGQGLMTEAAAAVRDWAFQNLPEMVRLQAFCVEENIGSSRVMEKIGMSHEGVRRKAFILKGKPVNLSDYSLIR